MAQFRYKELHFLGTDVDNEMLQILVHNLVLGVFFRVLTYILEWNWSFKRYGVRSNYWFNEGPVTQINYNTLSMLHFIKTTTPPKSYHSMHWYKSTDQVYQGSSSTTTQYIELVHYYKPVYQK